MSKRAFLSEKRKKAKSEFILIDVCNANRSQPADVDLLSEPEMARTMDTDTRVLFVCVQHFFAAGR